MRTDRDVAAPFSRPQAAGLAAGPDCVRRRFTLIELLVVIAIIAILASLLLPALGDAKRRANQLTCMTQVKQIQMATILYADNWDGQLPAPDQNSGLGLGVSFEWYKQLEAMAVGYGTGGSSEVTRFARTYDPEIRAKALADGTINEWNDVDVG